MCVLNLGHWERSRKRSTPQCFHHLMDRHATCAEHKRDPTCGDLFLHFLSNISAHVLIPQEAGTLRQQEKEVMEQHGWMTASPDKTLLRGIRANPWPGAYIHHFAGTRAIRRYKETPLQYATARLALVKSLGVKIGRKQACPTTRKLSVSSSGRAALPRIKMAGVVCMLSAFAPST